MSGRVMHASRAVRPRLVQYGTRHGGGCERAASSREVPLGATAVFMTEAHVHKMLAWRVSSSSSPGSSHSLNDQVPCSFSKTVSMIIIDGVKHILEALFADRVVDELVGFAMRTMRFC